MFEEAFIDELTKVARSATKPVKTDAKLDRMMDRFHRFGKDPSTGHLRPERAFLPARTMNTDQQREMISRLRQVSSDAPGPAKSAFNTDKPAKTAPDESGARKRFTTWSAPGLTSKHFARTAQGVPAPRGLGDMSGTEAVRHVGRKFISGARRLGAGAKSYLFADISGKGADKAEAKVPPSSNYQQPANVTA
jgi:hypothetical protein